MSEVQTITKLKRLTKKVNFNKLPKKCQRIAIVKDVIDQVRAKRFIATCGTYVSFGARDLTLGAKLLLEQQACRVCGIGSLFVSKCLKMNNSNIHYQTGDIHKDLADFFSIRQLELIESAFEVSYFHYGVFYIGKEEKTKSAIGFGQKYNNPEDRLVAIMENVVKNCGIFKP